MEVDDVDRRVLAALLADGRADPTEVGDVADVGPTTAAWRQTTLEDGGVIDTYRPRLNYAALGYEVTAVFELETVHDATLGVTERLREDDRLHTVYELAGPADLFAVGRFRGRADLVEAHRDLRETDGVTAVRLTTADPVAERDQFVPGD